MDPYILVTSKLMNNSKTQKKIAVSGLGRHAVKNILPAIKKSNSLLLAAVNTRNTDVLDNVSREYECEGFLDFEEMIDIDDIDIIYLSTPPGVHYQQAKKSLLSYKHVWIEKPLTTNLENTIELIEISVSRGLSLFECLMYQFHPQFNQINQYIRNDSFGKLINITSIFSLPFMPESGFRFNRELGGSCLYDVGIYPISLILTLFEDEQIDILNANISFDDSDHQIDSKGNTRLLINGETNCNLYWRYNSSYRNDIEIWGEHSSLNTKKIFSKDEEYVPILSISDINGNSEEIMIRSVNHFHEMLETYSNKMESGEFLDHHRQQIMRLAKFMDDIKHHK